MPRKGLGLPATRNHTHVTSCDIQINASVIDEGLGAALSASIEPGWQWRGDNGTGWSSYEAGRLTREAIVAVLDARLAQLALESWDDVTITARHGNRLEATSREDRKVFDLVIDATGAHRATLPMLQGLGITTSIEDAGRPALYQTFELALPEPAGKVHWGSVPMDEPTGALYGDIDGRKMRLTTSIRRDMRGRLKNSEDLRSMVNERVASLIPRGAQLMGRTSTIAPQMRRLEYPVSGLPNWIALGDALAQWAPRMGTGLGSLFRQTRLLTDAFRSGATPEAARAAVAGQLETAWDLNLRGLKMISENQARRAKAQGARAL